MQFLLLTVLFASCVQSYKILGVFPFPSRSHYHVGHSLMKGLAEDGHEVTVVSAFIQNRPIENYKEILLEHSWNRFEKGVR